MKSTTERTAHDQQSDTVASAPAKRPWHAPEIEEVDFAETEIAALPDVDGFGGSSSS